jgi:ankyrin repeat protein
MFILGYNQKENLNLSQEQIMHVIEKSDLTIQNKDGWTPLMYILLINQKENLNLSQEQIMHVIEKSDLNQQNKDGWNPLMYILLSNQDQNLNLSTEQIMQVMVKTNNVFDILKNNDLGFNSMAEECFLKIIQERNLGAQAIQYILDPDLQNKLPITSKTLTAIIDNFQNLNLEDKKKIGKEFDYFISEMNRLYPDAMDHLDDNHKNIISSLQVLSRKPNFSGLKRNNANAENYKNNALHVF